MTAYARNSMRLARTGCFVAISFSAALGCTGGGDGWSLAAPSVDGGALGEDAASGSGQPTGSGSGGDPSATGEPPVDGGTSGSGEDAARGGGDPPPSGDDGSSGADGGIPFTGRGMNVPWVELQAEDAQTNATVLGPSLTKWDSNFVEAEAIGRKAVRLGQTGDFVTFTTTAAANSIVVRFCIPDSPSGGGIDATLGLYVNGQRRDLNLTSHYSWNYLGATLPSPGGPNVEAPGPQPHTFWDETRLLLDEMPAGTQVTLKRDPQDSANFYVIDLVDFEEVPPPLEMPAGFTPITQFGVNPDDRIDHADDIERAMHSTTKLWFPRGKYVLDNLSDGSIGIGSPGTEVRGAGMWYTELHGPKALFYCEGQVSCVFGDFSIYGEATYRSEEVTGLPQKGFDGDMGAGSLIENVWIEHEVSGMRIGNDPPYQTVPTQGLTIRNVRIRDMFADGINLSNGTSQTLVQNSHVRNVGDDAAVVWAIKWTDWVRDISYSSPNAIAPTSRNQPDQGVARDNVFQNVSVQMPWRGPCFAAYGGEANHWKDNTCEDVLTYPGIFVDHEFSPYDYGPDLTTFESITLTRAGGQMYHEDANPLLHGAISFTMREGSVSSVLVQDVDVVAPNYEGIEFRGYGTAIANQYGEAQGTDPVLLTAADNAQMSNVTLKNVTVTSAGTFGIQVNDGGGRGTVQFDTVVISGSNQGAIDPGGAPDTFFDKVGGNSGW